MKNKLCKYLILLALWINITNIFSQDIKSKVKQDAKIDSLLQKKIQLDREQYVKTYFTLQLYYGDITKAEEVLQKSKETFPHIQVELSFETPNYKVQAGHFKDRLKGLKTLDTFKYVFPSAFLLTRKD